VTVGSGNSGTGGEIQVKAGATTAATKKGGALTLSGGTGAVNGDTEITLLDTDSTMGEFKVSGGGSHDFMHVRYNGGNTRAEIDLDTNGGHLEANSKTVDITTTGTGNAITLTTTTMNLAATDMNLGSAVRVTGGLTVYHGGVKITGGMTISGGIWVEGGITVNTDGITSTPGVTTSDQRLKTDIIPLPSPLSKVSKLRGVYFSWVKDEPNGLKFDDKRHIGVLAQDVQSVLPETVDEIAGGKYLGVDYPALIPLLIEAIKELNTRTSTMSQLEELMEIIRKHEEMINNINERLTQLETAWSAA
jgi:hypothetical protein